MNRKVLEIASKIFDEVYVPSNNDFRDKKINLIYGWLMKNSDTLPISIDFLVDEWIAQDEC